MTSTGKRVLPLKSEALGFSLVETVIAIAVIALAFIGIIGLLGLGVANDQTSTEQTVATNIAASIMADLRSTPNYSSNSAQYNFALPTPSTPTTKILYFDNNQNMVASAAGAAYKASIYLAQVLSVGPTVGPPTLAKPQATDSARVVITWPAQATTGPVGSVDIITEFRIN
jgi:uncharacterized protein (TIGR02598 family)